MWPGSSPSAVVNGAAGMIIAALLVAGLYAGQEILIPLALVFWAIVRSDRRAGDRPMTADATRSRSSFDLFCLYLFRRLHRGRSGISWWWRISVDRQGRML
jgi:hypothetical protein